MKISAENITVSRIAAIAQSCHEAALKIHMIAASASIGASSPEDAERDILAALDGLQIDPSPKKRFFTDNKGTWWKLEDGKMFAMGICSRSWGASTIESADFLIRIGGIHEVPESDFPNP